MPINRIKKIIYEDDKDSHNIIWCLIIFILLVFVALSSKIYHLQKHYEVAYSEREKIVEKINEVVDKTNRLEEWVINLENRMDSYHERGPIGVEPYPIEPYPLISPPTSNEQAHF